MNAPSPTAETALGPRGYPWVAVAALLLALAWRIWEVPAPALWRDWTAVVAVYGLLSAHAKAPRRRSVAALAAAGYLLGLYLTRQMPWTFAILGIHP